MYGVVILNYNSYDETTALALNLINFDNVGKIVIVDSNSNDDFTAFVVKNNFNNKIKYIKLEKNSGYAVGNNVGLRYLYTHGYEVGFIANPDVVFTEDASDKMYNFLKQHNNYGVVSCKRTIGKSGVSGQYWNLPNFKDCLFESIYFGRKKQDSKYKRYFEKVWNDNTSEYYDVEVVGGAFFGCNLSIMNKIGYLNEKTFLWYEENILAYNLRKYGYKEALLLNCNYMHNHFRKRRGNNKHDIYLKSKKVYCYDCLNVSNMQKILLAIFDCIGLIESKFIYLLAGILKH
ncbi:MAG: glycosyltransferase [Limosilactobacillus mucosae]